MQAKLAFVLVLLLSKALTAADWKIRLYWVHPPAEARVTVQGRPSVTLHAASAPVRFNRPLTLEVTGYEPLRLDLPLEITPRAGRLQITLALPREEYVVGVLGGESSIFRSDESLKAMAVAIRSYALHFAGRHRAEGFDFCDTTHCQDLRLAARTDRLRRAAETTEGELLWYRGTPASTYYHRHCGGMTEDAHDLWPDIRAVYLRSQPDNFCIARDRGQWHTTISPGELPGFTSPVEVVERTPSGRVRWLRANGRRISAAALLAAAGDTLGWNRIRSAWFDVQDLGSRVVLQGRGSGHGVGLCQTGAARMGEDGRSYRDILTFYYPGTKLGVSAQGLSWSVLGGEGVEVWTTQPGEDAALVALADRLGRQAEQLTGVTAPPRIQIRAYPTVAIFRDATAEPGTVAASTRGRTIRLQPPALLRSRAVLESTLLHEMLHVILEPHTNPLVPTWFREGLASALAGGRPHPAYAEATQRIQALLNTHSRATLLRWLNQGLPANLAP